MLIEIEIDKELDYEGDYFGKCSCGCGKKLYRKMTIFNIDHSCIYYKCLEQYLNKNKVVL